MKMTDMPISSRYARREAERKAAIKRNWELFGGPDPSLMDNYALALDFDNHEKKLVEHKAEQLTAEYESGDEWQAALAKRQEHLERAFEEAGLDVRLIPKRTGPSGMQAKRAEWIKRHEWRLKALAGEMQRRKRQG
jgi:hypothetical protein